ncbi:MAG: bifunctional folylpolyglutamate synthase/ dihydrofolate synthase, partial [Thiomicrorhabdus sp.]|nr:bifunctional folylpolyglutamate synthase/ dihydrofolate synthase [Thiomicrorhabdus sp.]
VCSEDFPPESLPAYAEQHLVPLLQLNRDFKLEISDKEWSIIPLPELDHISCSPEMLKNFPLPSLKGTFQIRNAAGVVMTLLSLSEHLKIDKEAIHKGLIQAKHPGRLESFKKSGQPWLVDVAHNPQSSNVLAEYLHQQQPTATQSGRYTAIFSVLNDKDALPMVQKMAPFVQDWLIADLAIPRATSVEALVELLRSSGVSDKNILVYSSIQQAVNVAQMRSEEAILVWGSFFTVSQGYACLGEGKPS